MDFNLRGIAIFCLYQAFSGAAFSQVKSFSPLYSLDYATAEVPASAFLNPNTDPILRPGNVREVALSYQTTALQAGAAPLGVEWSPWQSLSHARNLEEHARQRSLYRLTVSGAFARFPSSASRLGWGLSWTPVDKSDPLSDAGFYRRLYALRAIDDDSLQDMAALKKNWQAIILELTGACLDTVGGKLLPFLDSVAVLYPPSTQASDTLPKPSLVHLAGVIQAWQPETSPRQAELFFGLLNGYYPEFFLASARLRRGQPLRSKLALQHLQETFRNKNWNRAALKLGIGGTVFASDGHIESFAGERLAGFAAYATSFDGRRAERRWHQFLFHAQYSVPVRATHPERGDTLRQAFSLGSKVYIGDAQNRFFLQTVYTRMGSQSAAGPRTFGFWQGRTGYELRVVQGLYLSAEVGYTQFGSADGALLPIALVQVKYGFGQGRFGRP